MSKLARITQADIMRATKVAAEAHKRYGVVVRVIFRLATEEIEIVIGGDASNATADEADEWPDDEV